MPHIEHHFSQRSPYLRAAVLGGNDGIISMSGVLMAVTAAGASVDQINLTVFSALIAGALSMGAGEYISVSSQLDAERADIEREKVALKDDPEEELQELATSYEKKGLAPGLAKEVAIQLTKKNALKNHLQEELGVDPTDLSSPWHAAFFSFFSFLVGGGIPCLIPNLLELGQVKLMIYPICLLCLAALGFLSAKIGGAPVLRSVLRVTIVGILVLLSSQFLGENLLA